MQKFFAFFLSAAALLQGTAFAQSGSHPINFSAGRIPLGYTHSPHGHNRPSTAAKTTATDVRLISQVDLSYPGSAFEPADSVTLSYTGSMGGAFNDIWLSWYWKPDIGKIYTYNSSTSAYDPLSEKVTLTYDAAGNLLTTLDQTWNTSTSAWENSYRSTYTNDASGNVLVELDETWSGSAWVNDGRYAYTYNSAGKMASELFLQWNTTTSLWDSTTCDYYSYNTSGNLLIDSSEYYSSSSWVPGFKRVNAYDVSGNRINTYNLSWSGTGLDTVGMLVYSGFVAFHQPQVSIFKTWDATTHTFENSMRETSVFNTYGKPDYTEIQHWDGSSAWIYDATSSATRYHYETYTPSSVGSTAYEGASANLYPVPASNEVILDANWKTPQPFSVYITDMSGRVYQAWDVKAATQYHETIPLQNMPSGSYTITLKGTQGAISRQFSVVK